MDIVLEKWTQTSIKTILKDVGMGLLA